MKKSLIALFAAIALVLGSGAAYESAQAAYPNTIHTTSQIYRYHSVTEGQSFRVVVRVKAGNVTVNGGKVRVVIGGKKYYKSVSHGQAVLRVVAPMVTKTRPRLLQAKYYRAPGSVFTNSPTVFSAVVVKNLP